MLEALIIKNGRSPAVGDFQSFGNINLNGNSYSDGGFTMNGTSISYYYELGVPPGMVIRAGEDFSFELTVNTNSPNAYQHLFGDLMDDNGTGTYWLAINNVYQVPCMLTFETLGKGLPPSIAKRFRFGKGTTKFPFGRNAKIHIKRVAGIISASLDGMQFPETYNDNEGVAPVTETKFAIGGSSDGKYLFSGSISDVKLKF